MRSFFFVTAMAFSVVACSAAPRPCSEGPRLPPSPMTEPRRPTLLATGPKPLAEDQGAAGTWLFTCCDDEATWIGMFVLVQTGETLRGAWLTDGDSHGSYLEGQIEGPRVHLVRRWRTGTVLHEQFYELAFDERGTELDGTFTEPAYEMASHRVHVTRGFASGPRTPIPVDPVPIDHVKQLAVPHQERTLDPKRPCDCELVCYCGGVPPGPEHYTESARCGGSCKCSVCPALP